MKKLLIYSILLLATVAQSWATPLYTDRDLARTLKNSEQGMFYCWSPYMPLSVEGLVEAYQVAQELNLDFYSLLDPFYRGEIPAELKRVNVTHYVVESSTLFEMGILNHFPSITLYRHGEVIDYILYGRELIDGLRVYVKGIYDQGKAK